VDKRVLLPEKCYPCFKRLFDRLLGMKAEDLIGKCVGMAICLMALRSLSAEERSSRARSVSLIKDPAILEGMRYDVTAAVLPAFDLFQRVDQYVLGDIESGQSLP
jgi:hypothetical protein